MLSHASNVAINLCNRNCRGSVGRTADSSFFALTWGEGAKGDTMREQEVRREGQGPVELQAERVEPI